jgi:hypothetical protein
MTESADKPKLRTPSRWFIAMSSLAISGFAILATYLYGFLHWEVLAGPDMAEVRGTPMWDRAFSLLTQLGCIRPITGFIALIFAVWAMRYLPLVVRLGILAIALLALGMSLIVT